MSSITVTQNELFGITTDSSKAVVRFSGGANSLLKVCSEVINVVLGTDTHEKTALVTFSDLEQQLKAIDGFTDHLTEANKEIASTFLDDIHDLRKLRLSKGLSQSELAILIGTSQPHLNKIENGRTDPKLSTIVKLATVLQVAEQDVIEAIRRSD